MRSATETRLRAVALQRAGTEDTENIKVKNYYWVKTDQRLYLNLRGSKLAFQDFDFTRLRLLTFSVLAVSPWIIDFICVALAK